MTPATYQRRRIVALVVILAVLIVLVLGLLDGGDGGLVEAPQTPDEVISRQHAEQPVRFTLSVSGDLLIHSPVFEHALSLGGGNSYDFAPMFAQVRPYVAGADLAICHVETPMSPGPPTGFPIFNTPPELAKSIAQTGWEACDTASNHSLDGGQEGIDATLGALDKAGVKHTGSYASAKASGKPLILGVKGVRVAYLAYTTDTNGIPVPQPWSLNVAEDPGRILEDARAGTEAWRGRGDRQHPLGHRHDPRVRGRAELEAARVRQAARRRLGDHGHRRAGPARGPADRPGERQVRRLQRGQPGLEPGHRCGPGRSEPGRPDRAARHRGRR